MVVAMLAAAAHGAGPLPTARGRAAGTRAPARGARISAWGCWRATSSSPRMTRTLAAIAAGTRGARSLANAARPSGRRTRASVTANARCTWATLPLTGMARWLALGAPTPRPPARIAPDTAASCAGVAPKRRANSATVRGCPYCRVPGVDTAAANALSAAGSRGLSAIISRSRRAAGSRCPNRAPAGSRAAAPTATRAPEAPAVAAPTSNGVPAMTTATASTCATLLRLQLIAVPDLLYPNRPTCRPLHGQARRIIPRGAAPAGGLPPRQPAASSARAASIDSARWRASCSVVSPPRRSTYHG